MLRTVTAVGVIVPPQLAHTCAVSSAYVALFLDPWELALGTGPTRLNETETHRVLAALDHPGPGADLDAARAEFATLAGAGASLDSRVAHAVREITRPGSTATIGVVAAQVGLSQPRLRTLVRDWVGIPLPRLRLWAMLRTAMTELPAESAAAAAAFAGFADQAHLTRTVRTLAGRAPWELLQRPCPSDRPSDSRSAPSRAGSSTNTLMIAILAGAGRSHSSKSLKPYGT